MPYYVTKGTKNMPRYMNQEIFSALVVFWVMKSNPPSSEVNNLFADIVKDYLRGFPDEDKAQLGRDIFAAVPAADKAVTSLVEGLRPLNLTPEEARIACAKALFDALNRIARSKKPWWKRWLLDGVRFNTERKPLTGRVQAANKDITIAAAAILLRHYKGHF